MTRSHLRPFCLLRADASAAIGLGHAMRSLALAEAWQAGGGEATILGRIEPESVRRKVRAAGVKLVPLVAAHPDPGDLAQVFDHGNRLGEDDAPAWLVLDSYAFDEGYLSKARAAGWHVAVMDDHARLGYYDADVVINPGLSGSSRVYACRGETEVLAGPAYALVRSECREWRHLPRTIPAKAKNLLVTCGGSDPADASSRIVAALRTFDGHDVEARIVVGPANPRHEKLMRSCAELGVWARIETDASLPPLMAWADLAIAVCGGTCWELAAMGLPAAVLSLDAAQAAEAAAAEQAGLIVHLGKVGELGPVELARRIDALVADRPRRSQLSAASMALIDGHGARRVASVMRGRARSNETLAPVGAASL
jgi:UDP-2,4-diacetamido-2,4,6-trideoxy-beta-L-altropyranose hydrolase